MTDNPETERTEADVFEDFELPASTRKSRLDRTPKPTDESDTDDPITANQRIATFWRKHKNGRISTTVILLDERDVVDVDSWTHDAVRKVSTPSRYTVRAEVWKDAETAKPDATAHATRGSDDPDQITADRPQETAETAAVSRALRYLGIRLPKD